MAGFAAIADVGLTLVELLEDRMSDLDLGDLEDRMILGSPLEATDSDPVVLTVFLYRVATSTEE